MMSRRTKILLPTTNNLLAPGHSNYEEKQIKKQQKQAHYYNRHTKPLSELTEGQSVRVQSKPGTKYWEKGTVTRVLPYHSYELQVGGREMRRNRVQIRECKGADTTPNDTANRSGTTIDPTVHPEFSTTRPITPTEANREPCRTRSGRIVHPPKQHEASGTVFRGAFCV